MRKLTFEMNIKLCRLLLLFGCSIVPYLVCFSPVWCSTSDEVTFTTRIPTIVDLETVSANDMQNEVSTTVASNAVWSDKENDEDTSDAHSTSVLLNNLPIASTSVKADEEAEDDDYEDEEEDNTKGCSAQFILSKIIPDDYPTEISKDVTHINETIERINRMHRFSNKLIQNWTPFFRELGSHISDYLYEAKLESDCLGALFRIMSAANEQKPWALSFIDATGSFINNGYLEGKIVSLGEFDQCLAIKSELSEESVLIQGQYCLFKPIIPLPETINRRQEIANSSIEQVNKLLNDEYIEMYLELFKMLRKTMLRIGVCLPDKCKPLDVENAINKFLVRKTGLSVAVGPHCDKTTDEIKPNLYQVISLFAFGVLFLLILCCSIYELIYRMLLDSGRFFPSHPQAAHIATPFSFTSSHNQHSVKYLRQTSSISMPYTHQPLHIQVLTMFSIIRNTRVLFEIPAYRKLPVDTIRTLFIIYFFVANSYIFTIIFAPMVLKRIYVLGPMQLASEKKYFFIRLYYFLDIFLALSGISLSFAFKSKSFSYVKYIIQNYLRYALPILFSVGLIYVVPLFGSGPLFHLFDEVMTHNCKTNLWPTLFMYSNLNENLENICNLSSSFISLTFQVLLIMPLFLIIANALSPKRGTIFLVVIFCAFTLSQLIPRYYLKYKIPYEFKEMQSFAEIKRSIMFYGLHPAMHTSSAIFGLIIGHLLTRLPALKYSPTIATGVFLLIFHICGIIYVDKINMFDPNVSQFEIIGIVTFARVNFLSFYSWIIYVSVHGHISIVKRFLSASVWRPLAQLSFGFYITSTIVTMYRLFSIRETTTISADNMFRAIVSDGVVAFMFSYLIHLMVQQPMRNLRQILLCWKQLFDIKSTDSLCRNESPEMRHYSSTVVFSDNYTTNDNDKIASKQQVETAPVVCETTNVQVSTLDCNGN